METYTRGYHTKAWYDRTDADFGIVDGIHECFWEKGIAVGGESEKMSRYHLVFLKGGTRTRVGRTTAILQDLSHAWVILSGSPKGIITAGAPMSDQFLIVHVIDSLKKSASLLPKNLNEDVWRPKRCFKSPNPRGDKRGAHTFELRSATWAIGRAL